MNNKLTDLKKLIENRIYIIDYMINGGNDAQWRIDELNGIKHACYALGLILTIQWNEGTPSTFELTTN